MREAERRSPISRSPTGRRSPSAGRAAGPGGSPWPVSAAAPSPGRGGRAFRVATTRRCAMPCALSSPRAWRSRRGRSGFGTSAGVCLIRARSIYRTLGAEGRRHRRIGSREILTRRFVPLDYVPGPLCLPWLPSEREKAGAVEVLGIERWILRQRVHHGAIGSVRRSFPPRTPVVLDADRTSIQATGPPRRSARGVPSAVNSGRRSGIVA